MLALWPLVTVALFRRLAVDRALILSLLLGYLFLPEPPAVFDLPLMPPLTKHNIPALTAFVLVLFRGGSDGSFLPESGLGRVLLAVFVLSPALTVVTNAEPVFFGRIGLPGLGIKDAVALTLQQLLLVLPFLLARRFLATGGAQREILRALVWGGLVYSVLMLVEIRLSPQLNNWIYGYYQHFFGQSIRFGGYRPVVFLYHGLWVAFFLMTSAVAAWALWRRDPAASKLRTLLAALYLTAVLVLAKSMGALVLGLLVIPAVLLLTRRMQIRLALLIGLLALAYPLVKGAGLVPEQALLDRAAAIDQDRAYSLEFRFDNENTLLERAYLKPVFGWGSWGRNQILDPVTGFITTVSDGRWIIVIGVYGWVGFLAEFGLLLLPLILLWREAKHAPPDAVSPLIAPLSLLLAVNVADMIPNATLTPLTWMVAGALTGYAEALKAQRLGRRAPENPALPAAAPRDKPRWQSIM